MNTLSQFIKNIFTIMAMLIVLLPDSPTAKPVSIYNTKNTIKFVSQKNYSSILIELSYLNIKNI